MKIVSRNTIIILTVFLSLVLFISCPNNTNGISKSEEPEYKSNIVWELDVDYYDPCGWSVVDGEFLYQVEGEQFEEEGKRTYFYLSKVNLAKGEYVWKSSKIIYDTKVSEVIAKCGDNLFVYDSNTNNDIYCFSAATGEFLATIQISQTEDEFEFKRIDGRAILLSYKDRYLFWQNKNRDNTKQIVRMDTWKIDFKKAADVPQYVETENFAGTEHLNDNISSKLLLGGSKIFFQTFGDEYDNTHPKIGAVDCETGELKWIYEVENSFYGGGGYSLYVIDGKLYSFVGGLICFDAETGEKIFERIQGDDKIGKEVQIGWPYYTSGVAYWDNNFYYTTHAHSGTSEMTGIPEEYIKNIQCISARDGSFIWGDLPNGSGSMNSRPVVLDGKVFITTYYIGLRVYDAKTGKLIGVDKNIMSGGNERNVVYKDMLITVSHNSQWDEAKLIAIKP